ncbi:MAG: radical SAM protein [Thermoplasmatales archaeon]|nr:radical SAM protein [Thermoplasmatales archaeon]
MHYKQIKVDFLLNKITNKDKLFAGNYTIDPYQNCEFGCLYCDSSFDETIFVKTNAAEILKKELETAKKGTIIVGSVHDPYQKAEEELEITRELLKTIKKHGFSCHVLTKSDLVVRDIDILSEIEHSIVTLSAASIKDPISKIFEKNVPLPKVRLKTIEKLTKNGIKSGLAVLPVFPYIIETELDDIVSSAKNHNAQYLLYKHLELKGDQKSCFIDILKEFYPDLVRKYEKLYENSYMPNEEYISKTNSLIKESCINHNIKNKI